MSAQHTPETPPVMVEHKGRTYRVRPSQFGGFAVVEVLPSGIARPVRTLHERETVIAKATGGAK